MRKLILHMIVSIDGFISDPDGAVNPEAQWDEEMQQFYLELFTAADALVYGRGVYEQYITHWETVASGAIPAANKIELQWTQRVRDMHKFVISTTLQSVSGNASILRGDIGEELTKLKNEPGGDLLLLCGPSLLAQLTASGLIDEYMLYMCPSALGHGTHLFCDLAEYVKLDFLRSVPFAAGVNLLYYAPVHAPATRLPTSR